MSRQYLGSVDLLQHCDTNFAVSQQKSTFVNYSPRMEPRKLAQRAVIAGAGMLAIVNGVGGADLLAKAHADNPNCVVNAVDQCPRLADAPKPDAPRPPHVRTFCQPAGMAGQHCFQRLVP
jgi:hypothetical protein